VKDATGNTLANRTISWSSANTGIASVSSDGTVTGATAGSTTITASCEGVSASAVVTVSAPGINVTLDYSADLALTGRARTLSVNPQNANAASKSVTVNGVDTRAPTTPFTFNWGDGIKSSGFFPQSHTYASSAQNYIVRVTAHYSSGDTDSTDALVKFVAPVLTPTSFPAAVAVTIPASMPALTSRMPGYGVSSSLQAAPASLFSELMPRSTIEYLLSQAATVELSLLENDVEKVNGEWRQVVVNDPTFGGGYSLWFVSPMTLAAGTSWFGAAPAYSSMFHEMGHNLSLNAPAAFRLGGRIDGNANAIVSETLAQMLQHAVAYEMVNNASRYGLPQDMAFEIASSAHASAQVVQHQYELYLLQAKPFTTWNDPATPVDETLGAFMTLARQFMLHAEQGESYVGPLTRALRVLRTFNASLAAKYAPQENSAAADAFRATLMVAALSYGFQQDLRAEFRSLNFAVDDAIYSSLLAGVP
jgi:hypothetical protein